VKRAVVPALAALAVVLVACDDSGPYLFQAEQYEPGNQCVDNYAVIDNIDGDDPGALCSPVCLTNMGIYFITTECAPYPFGYVEQGVDGAVDPTCMTALAAFTRNDLCVDGGPPLNPLDASPDSAPVDAAVVDASAADTSAGDTSMGD
jgi:hypothetical protein